jgi:hypothetical protein
LRFYDWLRGKEWRSYRFHEATMAKKLKAVMTMPALWMIILALYSGMGDAQSASSQQRWQGFVTDTHCGTNCQTTKNMTPDKNCVDRCVRQGSKYGLWVGRHVYELEPQSKAAQYAASDVSVTGTLDGETIHIKSIEPGKRAAAKKPKNN